MECLTVRRKAAAYADNAMSQEERREMRQHMQDCQVCARESERYQRIREALRSLPRPYSAVRSDGPAARGSLAGAH